jgi:hypothetical protein
MPTRARGYDCHRGSLYCTPGGQWNELSKSSHDCARSPGNPSRSERDEGMENRNMTIQSCWNPMQCCMYVDMLYYAMLYYEALSSWYNLLSSKCVYSPLHVVAGLRTSCYRLTSALCLLPLEELSLHPQVPSPPHPSPLHPSRPSYAG